MTGVVALLLVAVAALAWPTPGRAVPTPLQSVVVAVDSAPTTRRDGSVGARAGLAVLLAISIAAGTGSPAGVAFGLVLGGASYAVMARSASARSRALDEHRRGQLPAAIDVLTLMLRTGAAPVAALSAAASTVGGPLAEDLRQIGVLQLMGTPAHEVWRDRLDDPVLGPLAGGAIRSARSGAALADSWAKLAADLRAQRAVRAEVVARRAGVAVLAPLGLCFLPAFICLGVVPIVIGLAGDVFG